METQIMMKAAHGRILVLTREILLAFAGAYVHEVEGMFAKLLSLQVSEDISASGLGVGNNRIRKFSIPLAQRLLARERKGVCRRYGPGKL